MRAVDSGKAVERIDLSRPPPIEELPVVTKALVQMRRDTKAGIDRFLQAVNEVEDDSKGVLDILVAALDAASHG